MRCYKSYHGCNHYQIIISLFHLEKVRLHWDSQLLHMVSHITTCLLALIVYQQYDEGDKMPRVILNP